MADIDKIIEGSLYTEIKTLKDGISIVMDPATEKLYYKKVLDVYSVPVFRFLQNNSHKNIPIIKIFWKEEGKLVVIEELIQGNTLEELLEKGRDYKGSQLGFEEKQRILLEICDGLIFLHTAAPPIIHRDIKASNVIIADDGSVKIIDYDAAKQYIVGKEKDTVLIGTQGIAAPEQYGFAQSDERTDIYSLGKLIERMMSESEHALQIAEKATKLQPELRYSSVEQMRNKIYKLWNPEISDARHRLNMIGLFIKRPAFIMGVFVLLIAIAGYNGYKYFMDNIYPEKYIKLPAYEAGVQAMEAGDYEAARSHFTECGLDYKNATELDEKCRVEMIKDEYVDKATEATEKYRESGTFDDGKRAVSACKEVQNQKIDNGEMLQKVYELMDETATQKIADRHYGNARDLYEYLIKCGYYSEDDDIIMYPYYAKGMDYYNDGDYDKAIDSFLKVIDYKDSKKMLNESRYQYLMNHLDSTDKLSKTCLSALKQEGYTNLELAEEVLNRWQATLFVNTGVDIASGYTVIGTIRITGGPSDNKEAKVIVKVTDSNGNSVTNETDEIGDDNKIRFFWNSRWGMTPVEGQQYKIQLYSENGQLMCEKMVTL